VSVLKIDKDCFVDPDWIRDWIYLVALPVCRNFGLELTSVRMTESRKGLHFYIGINPPVHAELANRLQWLLGDDCRRVDFNRARMRAGYPRFNKLFEPEDVRVVELYPCKVAAATIQLRNRGDTHS
jgi:hypothetical protein